MSSRVISGYIMTLSHLFVDDDYFNKYIHTYLVDAVTSSGILKAKQKLCLTFNSDKLGGIVFTKFSKLSMCSAGAGWYNGLGFLLGTAHGQF